MKRPSNLCLMSEVAKYMENLKNTVFDHIFANSSQELRFYPKFLE